MFDEKARRAILATFAGIIAFIAISEVFGSFGRTAADMLYPEQLEIKKGFEGVGKLLGFGVFLGGVVALLLRSRS